MLENPIMTTNLFHLLMRQSLSRLMAAIFIMLSFDASTGFAESLAETATNPVGNLIQLQIQDAYSWSNYESDCGSSKPDPANPW